jgi:uncharacterized protein HemY
MNRFTSVFLVVFVLFFSISQQTFSNPTEIQNIIEKATPDRSIPWKVIDSTLRFDEYFMSTLKSECGFKAFGYASKETAIDEMLGALKDKSSITSTLRSNKVREFIDNDHGSKTNFSSAENYLIYLKTAKHELTYQPNKNTYSKTNGVQQITEDVFYTLIDAFALLNKKNLYIYEVDPSKNKTLFLSHSYIISNNAEDLYLLRKGFHYNKLVPTKDVNSKNLAQNAETQYHEELRNYYVKKYQKSLPYQRQNSSFVSNKRQSSNNSMIINNNQNKTPVTKNNNKLIIDRKKPWVVFSEPDRQFHEYVFADKDSESIYKGLGFSSKKEALNALLIVLNKKNTKIDEAKRKKIKEYISIEMQDNNALLSKIFKNYTKNNEKIFYFNTKNQITFLTYVINHKIEINFCDHVENEKLIEDFSKTSGHGLIDALASLKDRNLYIYYPIENKQILLMYSFNLDPKKYSIYLIDKQTHFNKLVPIANKEGLKKAQQIEDQLNLIIPKKISPCFMAINNIDQSSDRVINNNNNTTSRTSIRLISNNIQRIDLTENEILRFLNDNSPHARIRNFDFKTSCQKIYDYYTFIDINSENFDSNLEDDCALAILFLSKDFVPSDSTEKEFCEDLLSKMNFIINITGSESKTKKYRHYARIYKARIYIALHEYQKAWAELIDLYFQKTSYTKCYYLDMAELIIDHQFTPKNTTRDQALQFAKSLLKTTGSRPNNSKRSHVRSVNISNIFHPNYRNDIESKQKEYQLSKKIEAEENIISDDSSSNFSSDESDAENPFNFISNDINAFNHVVPDARNKSLKRTRLGLSQPNQKQQKTSKYQEIINNNIIDDDGEINLEEEIEYVLETFSDQYLDHLKNKSRQALLRGNYYTKRNPNNALKFYTKGVEKYPSSDLYRALGDLYCHELKNYLQAKEIYEEGINLYPSSGLYRALGDLYRYDQKDFKQAKEIYEEGIKLYPSLDLYHALGDLYCYGIKNYLQAKEIYENGIKLHPSSDLYRALGDLYYYELRNYVQAKEIYEEGIKLYPSSYLYRASGDLYYYEQKDYKQAEKIYTEGIQKYPSSDLYCALGDLYRYEWKDFQQAKEIYEAGIKLYPSSDPYRALGDLYRYEWKDFQQAKEIYEAGIKLYPSSDPYRALGDLYKYEQKDYKRAEKIYIEGIGKHPSSDLYSALGDLYRYEWKDFKHAKEIYEAGIQKHPSAGLYRALGDLYKYEQKDYKWAEKIYTEGIGKYPSSDLYRALGDLYRYEWKDFKQAKEIYEAGIQKHPSAGLYRALGDFYIYHLAEHEKNSILKKEYQIKAFDFYLAALSFNDIEINTTIEKPIKFLYKMISGNLYNDNTLKNKANLYMHLGYAYDFDLARKEKNLDLKREYQQKALAAYKKGFGFGDATINAKIQKHIDFLENELQKN